MFSVYAMNGSQCPDNYCVCRFVCQTHMKSFLSEMKSSADDRELKHWFTMMKKRAPNLRTQQSTSNNPKHRYKFTATVMMVNTSTAKYHTTTMTGFTTATVSS